MRPLKKEDKAGLYITVITHLAVLIILLIAGLDYSLKKENSFVLDFTKYEELEKMQEEVERLQREADLQQAINEKLNRELGSSSTQIRNIAVDRADLKDDRGTDAQKLYEDAERLQRELSGGFTAPQEDDRVELTPDKPAEQKEEKTQAYSGPSVVSFSLEGRKASRLPIPAYRCMGAGRVRVIIGVDPSGTVVTAKVDESESSTDGCLRSFAIRAARLSKFSADQSAPSRQAGDIVYEFIAQ